LLDTASDDKDVQETLNSSPYSEVATFTICKMIRVQYVSQLWRRF